MNIKAINTRYLLCLQAAAIRAALLCMLVIVAACSSESPDPIPSDGLPKAALYITLGDGITTRAPQDGTYEGGTLQENDIDIEGYDFRILFFNSENVYLGSLDNIMVTPLDETRKSWYADGTIPAECVGSAGSGIKVLMIANWKGRYPELKAGVSTISDLAAASESTFDFEADGRLAEGRRIPMFGVSNLLTGLTFNAGEKTELGTLHMLRSFAKVRVRARQDSPDLKSVSITLTNEKYMQAPKNVFSKDDYVKGNYAGDYTSLPHIPASATRKTDLPLTRTESGEWYVYLPEFRNTLNGLSSSPLAEEQRARLEVTFEGIKGTSYVDFKYYEQPPTWAGANVRRGDHFDILRNNIYDFTLSKLNGETDLTVTVDVQPYASVEVSPQFGLERDKDGNIILEKYPDGTYKVIIVGKEMVRDEDGDFVIKYFSDGSVLCKEEIYKDFIHEEDSNNFVLEYEKDKPGGNMVIIREISTGGSFHGETMPDHDHPKNDRPLFVLDKKGDFWYVSYKTGKPVLSRTDIHGDIIIQANGFQFRNIEEMSKYIGTYVARKQREGEPPVDVLRDAITGKDLEWNPGAAERARLLKRHHR